MSKTTKEIAILVPGPLNAAALRRLDDAFTLLRMENGPTPPVPAEISGSVRGVAAMIPCDSQMMDALPKLEIIAHFGVGYDSVDVQHAAAKGIMITNTPAVLNEDVADIAIGLLLNAVRELPRAENWLRAGQWAAKGPYPLTRLTLRGRRAGIFGLGRVGTAVARRLEAFGLSIAYCNRHPVPGVAYPYFPTLVELARAVDTLISVVPSSPQTLKAVDAEVLRALGADGVFINIGRGTTVDQDALVAALADGTIAAAGLDVFADEPHVPQALLDLPNATLLPHVGSASEYTRAAMANLCVDNLIAWFSEGRALTPVPETAHLGPR